MLIINDKLQIPIQRYLQLVILFKILYGKEECIKDIIVTDLNSTDNTKEIVKKMSTDYECVKVTNWKECKDIIDNIDEIDKKC